MKNPKRGIPNQYLINERTRHGWSQQDIADRVGTTPVNVSRWERGITIPGPYFRQQLIALFDKSPEELGLLLLESPSPETAEQEFSQFSSLNKEEQDMDLSLPSEKASIASSYVIKAELPPDSQSSALPPAPAPTSTISHMRPWQSLRYSFKTQVIALTSLVLLLSIILGLFRLNSFQLASSAKKTTPQKTVVASAPTTNTNVEPGLATYGVTNGSVILDASSHAGYTQEGWVDSSNEPVGCYIRNDTYDIKETSSNYCLASRPPDASNFVYQAKMTILQGRQTGIMFRVDDNQDFYYEFTLDTDGMYRLYRSDPRPHTSNPILKQDTSAFINKGSDQSNWLGIKANGPDISLYINGHPVGQVYDSSYTSGHFGVGTVIGTGQSETEATYTNAKAWAF